MITVIEKPKTPPLQIRCRGCQALLSFEVEDLVGGYYEGDYTESGPRGVGFNCPECRRDIYWGQAPRAVVAEVWAKQIQKEVDV